MQAGHGSGNTDYLKTSYGEMGGADIVILADG